MTSLLERSQCTPAASGAALRRWCGGARSVPLQRVPPATGAGTSTTTGTATAPSAAVRVDAPERALTTRTGGTWKQVKG